ncbi:hypothetical protein [Paenibacillus sp. J2TS4]|uniref:hypothetical protein n=1 Tax=Paenibacillus sp. J2TS4 TaxID=2807194 RepID=UPI001B26821A|nr:hypothetical protein [Paenibacillus sp. J2TS4]GIP35047.1 hypothetical protein J2TS4_42570 [Paenibacillus sp. J2TS4]
MNIYSVKYTSTETLFDEEKQRNQNIVSVKAKDEEEAKQKVLDNLKAEGRHSQIVIHSARLEGKVKRSTPLLIGAILIAILILLSIFGR